MCINYLTIGRQIRKFRKMRKLSQESLAERIDRDTSFISCVETGKKVPSLETFARISCALNVSCDVLLSGNIHSDKRIADKELGDILTSCNKIEKEIILSVAISVREGLRKMGGLGGDF